MNHLSSRVISLVLAVIFLFSAAGISFATLFRGTTVYARRRDRRHHHAGGIPGAEGGTRRGAERDAP